MSMVRRRNREKRVLDRPRQGSVDLTQAD